MTNSSPNVELVRELFRHWNEDREAPRDDQLTADFEIHSPTTRELGEPYRGTDGAHRWVHELNDQFPGFCFELEELLEGEGRVLALGLIQLEGRGSGVGLARPAGWVIEICGGRFSRLEMFTDAAQARAAARL